MATAESPPLIIKLRLYLVRHGETVSNQEGLVAGQAESPLTPLGKRQAVALGKSGRLNHLGDFWRIYASDLQRTQETTSLILEGSNSLPTTKSTSNSDTSAVHLEPRLRELSKGARQGYPKTWSNEQAIQARTENSEAIPLLESEMDAYTRFEEWLVETAQEAVKEYYSTKQKELSVLVVSHSALLRAVLTKLFSKKELMSVVGCQYDPENPERLLIPNTSLTILEILLDANTQLSDSNNQQPKSSSIPWKVQIQELTWTGHYELL